MATNSAPDTIVLIHGLWMTPRSWEKWVPYYEGKGYKVVTPTYPGFELDVEALREDPTAIATATVPATVAHIADSITELDTPPIIMGHSFGGTLTQLLLDRGCSAAGVAINSAPTEGCAFLPSRRSSRYSRPSKIRGTGTRRSGSPMTSSTTRSPTRSTKRTRAGSMTDTTSLHPATGSGPTG
jgi:pimeloyl-ACP methyl ester carboxylesterase